MIPGGTSGVRGVGVGGKYYLPIFAHIFAETLLSDNLCQTINVRQNLTYVRQYDILWFVSILLKMSDKWERQLETKRNELVKG